MFKRSCQFVIAVLVSAVPAVRAEVDDVRYLNRKVTPPKEDSIRGTIVAESPTGIRVKQRDMEVDIPAADIVQITYGVPGISGIEFRQPFGKANRGMLPGGSERSKRQALSDALKGFDELLPRLSGNARRYVEFKIAQVKAEQSTFDPAALDGAIGALKAFQTQHPDSWEITACVKLLARLLEDKGDVQGAKDAYEGLAKIADVPAATKLESSVLVAKLLMRGGKYGDAEKKLQGLTATLPATDPQKPVLTVLLAQAQVEQGNTAQAEPLLRGALVATDDPAARALAHNVLGDLYEKKNQREEAFWEYLRVDVMYPQDREQHAKALYQLSKLFEKVKNDPVRGKECKERLADKSLADTVYARRAAGEK